MNLRNRFLVINEYTGNTVYEANSFNSALDFAQERFDKSGLHHIIYEMIFCGGTKTLADRSDSQ
jgi:hypothetical protein